jgi:hypothetical protein
LTVLIGEGAPRADHAVDPGFQCRGHREIVHEHPKHEQIGGLQLGDQTVRLINIDALGSPLAADCVRRLLREMRKRVLRNRSLIFAAAKRAFATSGANATMADIAREANVRVGSLNRAFGNRPGSPSPFSATWLTS